MNRLQWLAALLLIAEIAGGAYWWHTRHLMRPPAPDWNTIDPLAANEIRALYDDCHSVAHWRQLGECYMAYGFFLQGEACHRHAVALAPDNAELRYQWAFALETLGLLDEANVQYEKAIELGHPQSSECAFFIGRNHLRAEKSELAAAAFAKAGDLPAAHYELARLALRQGRRAEAVELAGLLGARHSAAVQPWLLRHRIERLDDESTQQEQDLFVDRAFLAKIRLPNPFDRPSQRLMRTFNELGSAAVLKECEHGNISGALEERLRDVFRRFWTPAAADLLAEVHFQRRQLDEARRILQEAIDRDGPSSHLLFRLGDVYEESCEMSQAISLWNRAIQLGSPADLKDLHAKLHQVHSKAGRHGLAQHHLAQAYFGAGVEAFWKNDLKKAQGALRLAVDTDPNDADAWLYDGDVARLLRQDTEARQAYERCLKLRPECSRAQRGLRLLK